MLAAGASSVMETEEALLVVLIQISAVIGCARLVGNLALRVGQPRVVGEIVGGLLLGPSFLGALTPVAFEWLFHRGDDRALYFFSQTGLILLMLQIGMEFDFGHLKEPRNRRAVLAMTLGSVGLPLAGGLAIGFFMHPSLAAEIDPLHFCLFVAVALAITALPILGRIMVDFNLTQTRLGSVTISAAALNDVIGWVLLAGIVALTKARFSGAALLWQAGGIAGFGLLAWFGLRPMLKGWLRRERERDEAFSLNFAAGVTLAAFLAGVITIKLGIFALFGGFIIGVLLYDEREFVAAWRRRVSPFIEYFFLPIFFTYTGLRTDAAGLNSPVLWLWCAAVVGVATATKCVGAYAAARWSGLSPAESRSAAVMMNTRALMELVVLNVGYELGVIPPSVFAMLVIMAVATTMMTTPLLKRFLRSV